MIKLNDKVKSYLIKLLQFTVSVLLIVVVLKKVDFNGLIRYIELIDIWNLALIILLSLFFVIFPAIRTTIGINYSCSVNLTWLESYFYILIGMFYNNILPSSIGGDFAKTYLLYRRTNQIYKVGSIVILERLIGLVATITISLLAALFIFRLNGLQLYFYYALIVGFITVLFLVLVFNLSLNKFCDRVRLQWLKTILISMERLLTSFQEFKGNKFLLIKIYFLSFIYQIADITVAFLVSRLIQFNVDFIYFLMFIPLVYIITLLPITVNGLGLRENIMVYLFTMAGATIQGAIVLSFFIYLDRLIKGLVGGVCILLHTLTRERGISEG